jgi:DNA-binding MarR family transcriptional regulator
MPKQKTDFKFPLTATNPILIPGQSDHSLRRLLYDFFTVAARMDTVKQHLGGRIGISAPQYTIMMAVAELQGKTGVSVGRVGEYLHVTGTWVTMESGKLAKKGFMEKNSDSRDRRLSLLCLSPKGVKAIQSLLPEVQQINDLFFQLASRSEFERLCKTLDKLVGNSHRAVMLIDAARNDPGFPLKRNRFLATQS